MGKLNFLILKLKVLLILLAGRFRLAYEIRDGGDLNPFFMIKKIVKWQETIGVDQKVKD